MQHGKRRRGRDAARVQQLAALLLLLLPHFLGLLLKLLFLRRLHHSNSLMAMIFHIDRWQADLLR